MIIKKVIYSSRGMLSGIFISVFHGLKAFLRGLYGLDESININYPLEEYNYSDRLQAMPELEIDDKGKSKCNSCLLCVEICPVDCLALEGEKGKEPDKFSINLGSCIYCSYCELICPEKAITMGHNHILAAHKEESLVLEFPEWKSLSRTLQSPAQE